MPTTDELIGSLIGELRGEGVVDSEGRFTLDPAKAREKMRRFQLADPRRYVLELVQAAHLRGATAIDFRIDADDMWMRFDGRPFTADELSNLYASLFADGEENDDLRALRQLALGVNAAMGMEPRRARVESGSVSLELRLDDADAIAEKGEGDGVTVIHVKQRLRPRVFLDFFRNLVGILDEERHLTERCAYAGIRITLNGKTIADGRREPAFALSWVSLEGMSYAGSAAFCAGTKAELRLLKDGVWISSVELENEVHGLLVVIEDPRLRKDVSQAKIVEDAAYRRVVAASVLARWRLLEAVFEEYGADPELSKSMGWLWREALERYADVDGLRNVPVLRRIAGLVSWPSARGPERRISLLELVQAHEASGRIVYGRLRSRELDAGDVPTPVITEPADLVWLRKVFGDKALHRADLNRELRRIKGEASFRARKVAVELGPELDCLARVKLRGRFRGEIGLSDASPSSAFWLVKDGSLLCKLDLNLPMRGLVLVVEGDFGPTEFFDDVVRDEAFAEDMFDILAGGVDLLAAAIDVASELEPDSDRALRIISLVKRYLASICSEDSALIILRRLGFGQRSREIQAAVGERLFPRLGVGRCRGERPHVLTKAGLFPTIGGGRRSLLEIDESFRSEGVVPFVARGVIPPTKSDSSILVLGRGDRRIVTGIFGEEVMEDNRSRVIAAARAADFMGKNPYDVDAELGIRMALRLPLGRVDELTPIVMARFDRDGTSGFVCLAPNRIDDQLADTMEVTNTRLLLRGRSLCEHALSLGVGPSFAVVGDDRLTPGPSWNSVVEDGAFDVVAAVIASVLGEVLGKLSAEFSALPVTDRHWAGRILLHAAASAAKDGPVPLPAAVRTLPLIDLLSGERSSLEQLRAQLDEDGLIEYVGEGRFSIREGERVAVISEPERADLEAIFGEGRLVDAGSRLTQGTYASGLRSRPPAPPSPSLPDDEVVSVDAMVGDGAEGVIGLPLRTEPGLRLDLCSLGRHIGTYVIPERAPLRAFFIDPKLPLTVGAEADLESERVTQIVRWCRRRIPALIAAAAERWEELGEREREALWVHIRPLFVDAHAREGRRAQVGWRAVRALPLFSGADGRGYSVAELERSCRGRRLRWISAPMSDVRANAGPLVILSEEQRRCLEGLFVLENYDAVLAREGALIAGGARPLPEEAPEDALISRRSVAAGGMQCLMWLPAEFDTELELDFGVGGLVFGSAPASPYLRCAGAVACADPCAIDAFEPRQLISLAKQVAGLYESLCARLQSGHLAKPARPVAIRYLRWVCAELDRSFPAELSRWQSRLRERITAALPALPTGKAEPSGAGMSPSGAGAPEVEIEIEVEDAIEIEIEVEVDRSTGEGSPSQGEVSLGPARAGTVVDHGRAVAAAEFEVSRTEDAAGAALLQALVAQLRLARVYRVGLLSDLNLSRLSLRSVRGHAVAEGTEHGLVVNSRHPLVAAALTQAAEMGGVEPMLLGALASAVYTVVNWQAEAIIDDDERSFLAALATYLGG